MFLGDYIERVGTGTVDMIRRCIEADLPEPQFKDDGFFSVIKGAYIPECPYLGNFFQSGG